MTNISQEIIDRIAEGEVKALEEGLQDPGIRAKPAFLAAVRKFLKENNLETTAETAKPIMKLTKELPVFEDMG